MAESNDWMRRALHEDSVEPPTVDTTKASVSRVYDYVLGGKDNFAVDRAAAHSVLDHLPESEHLALDNRAFVRRTVRYLAGEAGIQQFIDIGSGLPTAGNVHEIAQEVQPGARVVYVDNDPIVLAHGRALLADDDSTTVITADLREPDTIFDHPATQSLIKEGEPFAVLLGGIVQHLTDEEEPEAVVARVRERLTPGSYLMAENFHDSGEERVRPLERTFLEGGIGTGRFRTWDEQSRYFAGLDLVDPGLVYINDWRPDADTPTDSPVHTLYLGGVGRKP